jgi:hypothetical protein
MLGGCRGAVAGLSSKRLRRGNGAADNEEGTVTVNGNKLNLNKIWRIGVLASLAFVGVRAAVTKDSAEDTAPAVPDPSQAIVLQAAGGEIPFTIERLNLFLVEDDADAESFEFAGEGIRLVGQIPVDLRVGYNENWNVLIGKPISFSASNDAMEAVSEIHLPGEAACPVTGGTFTIHSAGESDNAKTPLSGELWLRCSTPAGERVLRGTFEVKGTTWG